ncbi:unnamed protein product, partial [Tilletia controversa]
SADQPYRRVVVAESHETYCKPTVTYAEIAPIINGGRATCGPCTATYIITAKNFYPDNPDHQCKIMADTEKHGKKKGFKKPIKIDISSSGNRTKIVKISWADEEDFKLAKRLEFRIYWKGIPYPAKAWGPALPLRSRIIKVHIDANETSAALAQAFRASTRQDLTITHLWTLATVPSDDPKQETQTGLVVAVVEFNTDTEDDEGFPFSQYELAHLVLWVWRGIKWFETEFEGRMQACRSCRGDATTPHQQETCPNPYCKRCRGRHAINACPKRQQEHQDFQPPRTPSPREEYEEVFEDIMETLKRKASQPDTAGTQALALLTYEENKPLKVATFNCGRAGLTKRLADIFLTDDSALSNADIIFLQECQVTETITIQDDSALLLILGRFYKPFHRAILTQDAGILFLTTAANPRTSAAGPRWAFAQASIKPLGATSAAITTLDLWSIHGPVKNLTFWATEWTTARETYSSSSDTLIGADWNATPNPLRDSLNGTPGSCPWSLIGPTLTPLHIQDAFRHCCPDSRSYSRIALDAAGNITSAKRIDSIWASTRLLPFTKHPRFSPTTSDHHAVSISLAMDVAFTPEPRTALHPWTLHPGATNDIQFRRTLLDTCDELGLPSPTILTEDRIATWEDYIRRLRDVARTESIRVGQRLKDIRTSLTTLGQEVENLHLPNPDDAKRLPLLLKRLNKARDQAYAHAAIATTDKATLDVFRPSSWINTSLARSGNSHTIQRLRNSRGTTTSDPDAMSKIARSFFAELYSAPPPEPNYNWCQARLLQSASTRFTPEDIQSLESPFSMEELSASLRSSNTHSAPGPLGLGYSFLLMTMATTGPHLLSLAEGNRTGLAQWPLVMDAIRMYEVASGARLNRTKSGFVEVTHPSHQDAGSVSPRTAMVASGFQEITTLQHELTHLGHPINTFGQGLPCSLAFGDRMHAIGSRVEHLQTANTDIITRTRVANSLLLPKLWHHSSVGGLPVNARSLVSDAIRPYLYLGDKPWFETVIISAPRSLGGLGLIHPDHMFIAQTLTFLAHNITREDSIGTWLREGLASTLHNEYQCSPAALLIPQGAHRRVLRRQATRAAGLWGRFLHALAHANLQIDDDWIHLGTPALLELPWYMEAHSPSLPPPWTAKTYRTAANRGWITWADVLWKSTPTSRFQTLTPAWPLAPPSPTSVKANHLPRPNTPADRKGPSMGTMFGPFWRSLPINIRHKLQASSTGVFEPTADPNLQQMRRRDITATNFPWHLLLLNGKPWAQVTTRHTRAALNRTLPIIITWPGATPSIPLQYWTRSWTELHNCPLPSRIISDCYLWLHQRTWLATTDTTTLPCPHPLCACTDSAPHSFVLCPWALAVWSFALTTIHSLGIHHPLPITPASVALGWPEVAHYRPRLILWRTTVIHLITQLRRPALSKTKSTGTFVLPTLSSDLFRSSL